jgi:SulP family sulfate permease
MPTVQAVVPDETFRHFVERADAPACPQLAVMNIRGTLFFGAVSHVEDVLLQNLSEHPGQNLLLLRMHGVDRCDLSAIEALEGIVKLYRERGGDVFMVQLRPPVREIMRHSGFEELLGTDHILAQEQAIDDLFEHHLDPAVCCYECEHRVFAECQALVKHPYDHRLPSFAATSPHPEQMLSVPEMEAEIARAGPEDFFFDLREPEEHRAGHIHGARSLPLREVIEKAHELPRDRKVLLCCRSGRRGSRAVHWFNDLGFEYVRMLKGGILSWKAFGRPLEVD